MIERINIEKGITKEYPEGVQLTVVVYILKSTEREPYIFESFKLVLPSEEESKKINNLKISDKFITFDLIESKSGEYEYLVPESISEISDYIRPSPQDYKFFIKVGINKEKYGKEFLICGSKSGKEIPNRFYDDNNYYWNIFSGCYLLKREGDEIVIFYLTLKIIRENEKITKIKINSEKLSENNESIKNNQGLLATIQKFKENKFKQDVNQ